MNNGILLGTVFALRLYLIVTPFSARLIAGPGSNTVTVLETGPAGAQTPSGEAACSTLIVASPGPLIVTSPSESTSTTLVSLLEKLNVPLLKEIQTNSNGRSFGVLSGISSTVIRGTTLST